MSKSLPSNPFPLLSTYLVTYILIWQFFLAFSPFLHRHFPKLNLWAFNPILQSAPGSPWTKSWIQISWSNVGLAFTGYVACATYLISMFCSLVIYNVGIIMLIYYMGLQGTTKLQNKNICWLLSCPHVHNTVYSMET